jgi:hypothetical protein
MHSTHSNVAFGATCTHTHAYIYIYIFIYLFIYTCLFTYKLFNGLICRSSYKVGVTQRCLKAANLLPTSLVHLALLLAHLGSSLAPRVNANCV